MDAGPVLSKVAEAAAYVQNGATKEAKALSDNSILLLGNNDSYCHVDYDSGTGGVILCFVGNTDWDTITKDRYSGREKPSWVPGDDIKCHAHLLAQFDSLLHPKKDTEQLSLLEAIMFQSNVRQPPACAVFDCSSCRSSPRLQAHYLHCCDEARGQCTVSAGIRLHTRLLLITSHRCRRAFSP